MRTRVLLLLTMLLASLVASAQDAGPHAALEAEIRALDLAHAAAIFQGDSKALDVLTLRYANYVCPPKPASRPGP